MPPDREAETITTGVLIVGSGPGGAVTGTVFAEAGLPVLMIEEGAHLPLDSAPHFSRAELLQKYRGGGIGVAFGRDKMAYVEGRCVGGGSEINRGLYYRAPAHLLDRWRSEFAVRDLDEDSLTPHFEACEAIARVEYLPGEAPAVSTRLRDGATAMGWSSIEAPRLYHYGSNGRSGRKQSMSETFIPRFRAAGGRLMPDTRAVRLRQVGRGWQVEAVQTMDGGRSRPLTIRADTVVVAGGAVQTPLLLRRSGIRRNVGDTLRFHPMLKLVARFPEAVSRPGDLDPVHQVKHFEPVIGMGCSISTPPMLGMALTGRGVQADDLAQNWRRMGIYYVQSTGGRAKVRSLPFSCDPLVTARLEANERAPLLKGLKQLAEALFAAGAETIYPVVGGWPVLRSRDDLGRLADASATGEGSVTAMHLFSSCPMGEDRRRCAADSFGKVHGVDGLYIADASLLCGPTSVNPQGTVMAVARRNAIHAVEAGFR